MGKLRPLRRDEWEKWTHFEAEIGVWAEFRAIDAGRSVTNTDKALDRDGTG